MNGQREMYLEPDSRTARRSWSSLNKALTAIQRKNKRQQKRCCYKLMQKSIVSIIVPCYNYAALFREALDSVLAQTYDDWECIIVNDGSTDDTEEIALQYCQKDERFIYFYKENGGHSSARNYGIKKSKGEYILPLDPDDKIA